MTRYAILAVLILTLLSAGAYIQHLRTKLRDTEQGRDAAISDYKSVTTKYINANGDIVKQSKAFELTKREFIKAAENKDLEWAKKFNNYKNIQTAQSFTTTVTVEKIKRDTIYLLCDSIQAIDYHYKDDYNEIKARVIGKPVFNIRDRYYVVVTKNRPKNWFIKFQWSRWEFKGQVTNLNKLIQVDSVQTIFVK